MGAVWGGPCLPGIGARDLHDPAGIEDCGIEAPQLSLEPGGDRVDDVANEGVGTGIILQAARGLRIVDPGDRQAG